MKRIIVSMMAAISVQLSSYGQDTTVPSPFLSRYIPHLEVGALAGTEGIGFDFAVPVNDMIKVRAGYSIMPHFDLTMNFHIDTGKRNPDGTWESTDKFKQMQGFFKQITGFDVDDNVKMKGKPTYHNFKFLCDITPFKDKHWHLSAGFYIGNSTFGEAVNDITEASTLVGVGVYNNMYNKITSTMGNLSASEYANNYIHQLIDNYAADAPDILSDELYKRMINSRDEYEPWISLGDISACIDPEWTDEQVRDYANKVSSGLLNAFDINNIFSSFDITKKDPEGIGYYLQLINKMQDYGRVGIHVGDYSHDEIIGTDPVTGEAIYQKDKYGNPIKKGAPYIMEPDELGMVRVSAKANVIKPFLGFGYGNEITKDKKTRLSFECGIMFWGGTPQIITHDGTDLAKLNNVTGRVGDYVKALKSIQVFPTLNVRISHAIF